MHGAVVAPYWLAKNLLGREFGNMLQNQIAVSGIGHNKKVLRRDDSRKTLESHAYERFSRSQNIQKLLGMPCRLRGQKRIPTPPAIMTQYLLLSMSLFLRMQSAAHKAAHAQI